MVFESIKSADAPFGEWSSILDNGSQDEIEKLARVRLVEKIADVDDLKASDSYLGDDDVASILVAIKRLGLKRNDLEDILDDMGSCTVVEAVLTHLIDTASSVVEVVGLYIHHSEITTGDQDAKLSEKLKSLATKSELGLIDLLAEEGSSLQEIANEALGEEGRP